MLHSNHKAFRYLTLFNRNPMGYRNPLCHFVNTPFASFLP